MLSSMVLVFVRGYNYAMRVLVAAVRTIIFFFFTCFVCVCAYNFEVYLDSAVVAAAPACFFVVIIIVRL